MRTVLFRILAGFLGTALLLVAFPVSRYSQSGFWPRWVHVVAFLAIGVVFLTFALTGRTWPKSYGRKVFGKHDDRIDR